MTNPFVPAVQPGSKLDWDMAADSFASTLFNVRGDYRDEREVGYNEQTGSSLRPLTPLTVANPSPEANGLFLARETLRHPISPSRLYLPWAAANISEETALAEARADVKGHWLRGRRLFFGVAGCATCHTVRGEGMTLGPDLSNLIHRDRDSVLQDLLHPSATINPDHPGTLVTLNNGAMLSGIVRSATAEKIVLALPAGIRQEIDRSDVADIEPLKASLMPDGLDDILTNDQLEDLLAFLLVSPLEPVPM